MHKKLLLLYIPYYIKKLLLNYSPLLFSFMLNGYNNLKDKQYSQNIFKLSFPLLSTTKENYWKDTAYNIQNMEYRFCSEFGGSHIIGGITRTERDGKLFLEYLKNKNLLLDKYQDKEIHFIVGDNNQNTTIEIEEIQNEDTQLPSSCKIKNIILYGVAGVGKTYSHKKLIALIEGRDFSQNQILRIIKMMK